MTAGRTTLWGALVLLLLVGTVLVLGAIALIRRGEDQPIGGEIVWDDFGFRVLGVETAERIGESGNEIEANGAFRIVRLHVTNHAKSVDYRLDSHIPLLFDSAGDSYRADARAGELWRARAGRAPAPDALAPGESAVTELVFDLPAEADGLVLCISWGSPLENLVTHIRFGDRRILLE